MRRRRRVAVSLSLSTLLCQPLPAPAADVPLGALADEMKRSLHDLHLSSHPIPYFVSYTIQETVEDRLASCLGSPAIMDQSRYRSMHPILRLGDYDLDSSWPLTSNKIYTPSVTTDDDYKAIRRIAWLASDYAYKAAVTVAEWKKAYLRSNEVSNRLPDFAHAQATVDIGQTAPLKIDDDKWAKAAEEMSGVFKDYPSLQRSKVIFRARNTNRWMINSEGTKIVDCQPLIGFVINAGAQAADGMPLADSECIIATSESALPPVDELKAAAKRVAQRLSDLQKAPKSEDYCGPVIFEGQGAAEFFSQVAAPNFGFAAEYIGQEDFRNPWKNAIGRKVFSAGVTIEDDPLSLDFKGTSLVGGFKYDDEGVPAQKLTLVDDGVLKGFCQSRLHRTKDDSSNGHSLGGHGVPTILHMRSLHPSTPAEIKQKAAALAQEAGLDYVLVIQRIADEIHLEPYPQEGTVYQPRAYATPSYSLQPSDPLVCYRWYFKDDKKEPVRGLEFHYVSLRAFRDIQAIGSDDAPYVVEPADGVVRHVITPTYLIGELELAPVKAEHASVPTIPSPLAEQSGTAPH